MPRSHRESECSKGRRIAYMTAVLDSKRRHLHLALAISCSLRYMAVIGWRQILEVIQVYTGIKIAIMRDISGGAVERRQFRHDMDPS